MDSPELPFTQDQVDQAGLLGDGLSAPARQVYETMKDHPTLLKLSLFALECIDLHMHHQPSSHRVPASSPFSDSPPPSPDLVYRSDFLDTPFPKPTGRYSHLPVKTLRGVFDTTLNPVWEAVGPQIRDILKAHRTHWSSIDPARFFTHTPVGLDGKGSLGPVVIWIGVAPNSTSADTAHEISQEILTLLRKNGVEDAVVEWREAVPQKLVGPPLMKHANMNDPTHHVRRPFTALLGVPLTNQDTNGNPSRRVLGVSNCHVLRRHPSVDFKFRADGGMDYVRVCGRRRFQKALGDITRAISHHSIFADSLTGQIIGLQAEANQDAETVEDVKVSERQLQDELKAVTALEALHRELTGHWSDLTLQRDIGHMDYAPHISLDVGGAEYTTDWGAFQAAEAKVRAHFEGNVVDVASKYSIPEVTHFFGKTSFKFPVQGKLRIEGCGTKEELASPGEVDDEGIPGLMVGKNGSATDLTVGRYAGLFSFLRNALGIVSGIGGLSCRP
ncbi:hypothetical protein C8R46DRAFT_1225719 [Mycena filopes]|nr:hypothetical protein C8R46DRAFT_1225719 [Mycena filopes]